MCSSDLMQPLTIVRFHDQNHPKIGTDHRHRSLEEFIDKHDSIVINSIIGDVDICRSFWLFKRRLLSRFEYVWGGMYASHGRLSDACKHYIRAIGKFPLNWKAWVRLTQCLIGIVMALFKN